MRRCRGSPQSRHQTVDVNCRYMSNWATACSLLFCFVLTSWLPAAKYEPDEADTLEQPQHQVVEVAEDSMQYTEDNTQYTEEDYGDYTTNKNYGVAVELDDSSKGKHEHGSLQENLLRNLSW